MASPNSPTGALLEGVTVVNLATVGPAARAAWMLADYGATVVRVGAVPKDGGVQIVPPFFAYGGDRDAKRVQVDLKAPAGKEAFLRLAASADVVIESFRPGVVDRLGIGYEAVRSVRPDIVYCSTSGYGQDGPYSSWAGHDVNYLALGGFLDCTERAPHNKPPLPGATVADSAGGGMHAVMAILAALVHRANTGEGRYLDVAVVDGVLSMMALAVDEYLATGTVPGPGHNILTGRYACYDTYRCADGRWVSVGAIEPHFYRNLCRLLDCDHRAGQQLDDDAQESIRSDFAAAFARKPRDEWVALLAPADTCVAPVYTIPELTDDPHLAARGVIVDADHPSAGRFPQLGHLLAGTDKTPTEFTLREGTDTDTDEVLAKAGLSAADIASLREQGAIA